MKPVHVLAAIAASLALVVGLVAGASLASPEPRPTGVISATPNMTPPPTNYSYFTTTSAAEKFLLGRTVGPNVYTYYGRSTITGFRTRADGGRIRTLSVVQYPNPVLPSRSGDGLTPMTLYSWYNPASWDWKHILGVTWTTVWDGCLKGGVYGFQGGIGASVATRLITRGAEEMIGPEGVVAAIVGGCFANLTTGP